MNKQVYPEKGMGFIIGASSVGTLIEWYDFYIFGMLATIISKQFFPEDSGTSALLSTLAGLWYPIGVAALCIIIGSIYLTN